MLGHGFGSNTLIELADGSQKTIYNICLNALHDTVFVESYNSNNFSSITPENKAIQIATYNLALTSKAMTFMRKKNYTVMGVFSQLMNIHQKTQSRWKKDRLLSLLRNQTTARP